uniref:Uncharacterized protein n=1 Tax=Caenorhabditis tropicalis TaxID=1561998 RepID=A0A1I7UAB6_9PELO
MSFQRNRQLSCDIKMSTAQLRQLEFHSLSKKSCFDNEQFEERKTRKAQTEPKETVHMKDRVLAVQRSFESYILTNTITYYISL